jgi:hypothetical protein
VLALATLGSALLGCPDDGSHPESGDNDAGPWVSCDPWSQQPEPVVLGEVLGAGRADDDRLFLIDRDADERERLFVSEGDVLVRQPIGGASTESAPSVKRWSVSTTVDGARVRVLLERSGSQTRMLLLEGDDAAGRDFDLSNPRGKPLEIVGASAYRSLQLRNLPALAKVEYAAQVEPSDRLVVLGPEHLESFDDYVLFFGPPARVRQREVLVFGRARDGGTTTIEFDLDGRVATAHFPNRIQPSGPPITEPVTFEVEGDGRTITRLPSERATVENLSFECLR